MFDKHLIDECIKEGRHSCFSKDSEKESKNEHIQQWMKEHAEFVHMMDAFSLDIAMGKGSPDEKFDARFVRSMLKQYNLETDFTAAELLKVWRKR